MARSGRFGNLPGKSPDLTATITAMLEQYESARDRNILSAWMNGGKFEGEKVTDQRLQNWYKMRRNQYTKDDPEYDYWDQQLTQVNYQIGESKMLLSYEQGKIKEGAAAAWYTQNAKRFPKNSEAWREAMRNAARFKKAGQEAARSTQTLSDSERYQRKVDAIKRQKIEPAQQAQRIWEEALANNGLLSEYGFMGLDITAMQHDEAMATFMASKDGRKFARQYKNATGETFSYKSFRRLINGAERGWNEIAGVSRDFGYQSYVESAQGEARNWGKYGVQLAVFNADIYDDYVPAAMKYYDEFAKAKTQAERDALRADYKPLLDKLIRRAEKRGDNVLIGTLRNERRVLDGKEPLSSTNPEVLGGGNTGTGGIDMLPNLEGEQQGTASTVLSFQGNTVLETQAQQAVRDKEIKKGLRDGTWVRVKDPKTGFITEKTTEEVLSANPEAGSSFRQQGYITNWQVGSDGSRVRLVIPLTDLTIESGGTALPLGAKVYQTQFGQTRYQYVSAADGEVVDTTEPPWAWLSEYDDGDITTPPGMVRNPETGGLEKTYWVDGEGKVHLATAIQVEVFGQSRGVKDANGRTITDVEALQGYLTTDAFGSQTQGNGAGGFVVPGTQDGTAMTEQPNPEYDPAAAEAAAKQGATTAAPASATETATKPAPTSQQLLDEQLTPDQRLALEALGIPPEEATTEMLDWASSQLRNMGYSEEGFRGMDEAQIAEAKDSIFSAVRDNFAQTDFVTPQEARASGRGADVPSIAAQVQAEGGYNVSPTIMVPIEKPAVLNDTGTTVDSTGQLGQYQSPMGRVALASMTYEERDALAQDIIREENLDPVAAMAIYGEIDALARSGAAGEDESAYVAASGAMSDDEKFKASYTIHMIERAKVEGDRSLTEGHGGIKFINNLKADGWSDDAIREQGWGMWLDQKNEADRNAVYGPDATWGTHQASNTYSAVEGGADITTMPTVPEGAAEPGAPVNPARGTTVAEIRAAIEGVQAAASPLPPVTPPKSYDPLSSVRPPAPVSTVRRAQPQGPAPVNPVAPNPVTPYSMYKPGRAPSPVNPVVPGVTPGVAGPIAPTLNITRPMPVSQTSAPSPTSPSPSSGGFKLPWEPGGFFNQ